MSTVDANLLASKGLLALGQHAHTLAEEDHCEVNLGRMKNFFSPPLLLSPVRTISTIIIAHKYRTGTR